MDKVKDFFKSGLWIFVLVWGAVWGFMLYAMIHVGPEGFLRKEQNTQPNIVISIK